MARGWESKSVEEQQAQAETSPPKPQARLTPGQLALARQREGLLLSRKRVVQQLQTVVNPRHQKMLQEALAHLDSRLAKLED